MNSFIFLRILVIQFSNIKEKVLPSLEFNVYGNYLASFIFCFYDHISTAAAKSLQSCPTLCNPIDGSPPGSPIPGILQARTLEWVAISFFNAWRWKVKVKSLSRVRLLATPWTAAHQAPPSMGFSRQEYWSRVPLPSPTNTLQKTKAMLRVVKNIMPRLKPNIWRWHIQ